jgi:hypothetical protein
MRSNGDTTRLASDDSLDPRPERSPSAVSLVVLRELFNGSLFFKDGNMLLLGTLAMANFPDAIRDWRSLLCSATATVIT